MSQPTTTTLRIDGVDYRYYDVAQFSARLPLTVAVLAESLMRHDAPAAQLAALAGWHPGSDADTEIEFHPARVVMQDFTGVPCIVDLAAMREAVAALGGDARRVNPQVPTELVIDHSVIADEFGSPRAFARNVDWEFERNAERYQFLKWGQKAFSNFQVVPPDTGIVHQVNLEHLARVVMRQGDLLYPDSCVGTDSHTTMINGLGVLGWGVGGIEAEAAMLGQAISLTLPVVVGVELTGSINPGVTSTDLVLAIAERLRAHGVVGKFVEFFGAAVATMSVETRATIANMSPEYGSTACLFPIDQATIDYLQMTGRSAAQVSLVEEYAKAQGFWGDPTRLVDYSEQLTFDLSAVVPSLAGPKRPQDRIDLSQAQSQFKRDLQSMVPYKPHVDSEIGRLESGLVAVAAITSCTNTSNPRVMMAAGLLAKAAVEAGLSVRPWVKTTLSPGSQVVTDYLQKAGVMPYLERLGFDLAGYGCVTCIGNTGPVVPAVRRATEEGLVATAVLSGNRNFEGRISPDVRMNYLASPPLVVAYALAGTMDIDLTTASLGQDTNGVEIHLADIWPSDEAITAALADSLSADMFTKRYADVFTGSQRWQALAVPEQDDYDWPASTYIARPPYFDQLTASPVPLQDVADARILALLGDSVTTDHISPAGAIKADSPAGHWLAQAGLAPISFNSYGSRRGNHQVMMRGTFANIRLTNQMLDGVQGGFTRDWTQPDGPMATIFEASANYMAQGTPLVVVAGSEYGSGSSRDWAAKGAKLLGVAAVLAVSFERIHRSNLVGMGILPLQFLPGESAKTWGLTGQETIRISGLTLPGALPDLVEVQVDGLPHQVRLRVDTPTEERFLRHGGILPYQARVLAGLA
ncbi:MAG: aconitate hydratase AcnA [Propionibacteriaceae bacterium]|jgi:aconitate hydratase|nr:aconitate hydratase AcnA [Propionibacteriaceae bacterium]